MGRPGAALNNTTENESLCASCRYIADHWYEVKDSGRSRGFKPYSIRKLLLTADSGCLLCRLILDNSGDTRDGLEKKKVDLEEIVNFSIYALSSSSFEIVVRAQNHGFGPEIKLFQTHRSNFPGVDHLKQPTKRASNPRIFSDPRNTDNAQTWGQAKKWIETCTRPATEPTNEEQSRLNHWRCQQPVIEPDLPTRLIRVGQSNSDLKLCLTSEICGGGQQLVRYAAVSHCWGKQKFFVTTDDNVAQMQQLIPFELLTKSLQDCIIATRRLDLEYVWVDSLCIIQGSKSDWEIESARMGSVYAFCTVNLVAADAHDGTVGCFFQRDATCVISVRHDRLSLERKTLCCDIEDDIPSLYRMESFKTSERGWCFQETFLSPRSIYFSKRQVWFECRCSFANELYPKGYSKDSPPNRLFSWRWANSNRDEVLLSWDYVVETFTKRSLMYWSDRLIAIGGVARSVENFMNSTPLQRGSRPRYLAGLWGTNLELQLCWYVNDHRYIVPETSLLTAPSWSWASVPHGIGRQQFCETNLKLIGWHVTLDTQDEFGAVKDGFIELSCHPLVPIALSREWKGLHQNQPWDVQIHVGDRKYKKTIAWMDHPSKVPEKLVCSARI